MIAVFEVWILSLHSQERLKQTELKALFPGYERLGEEQAETPVILLNEGEMIESEESGGEVNDVISPCDVVVQEPMTSQEGDETEKVAVEETRDDHVGYRLSSFLICHSDEF